MMMGDSVYMQWVEAQFANIRTTLIVLGAAWVIVGLCASLADNFRMAYIAGSLAFLCKWVECWLLNRELVKVQLQLEES